MAAEKDGVCGRGAQAPLAQKKLIPPKRICLVMIRRPAAAVVLCSLKPAAVLSFSLLHVSPVARPHWSKSGLGALDLCLSTPPTTNRNSFAGH